MAADGSIHISWKEEFETGIPEMDRQHMWLVGLINDLYVSMETGTSAETENILSGLVEYTNTHFVDEERLQERHGCPGLEEHRKMHDDLLGEVLDFRKRFQNGEPGIEAYLMWFMKDWLINHIKLQDTKIARHILGK